MSIDDGFKKMLDGVQQANEGRDEIMRGLEAAVAEHPDLDAQLVALEASIAGFAAVIGAQAEQFRAIAAALKDIKVRR